MYLMVELDYEGIDNKITWTLYNSGMAIVGSVGTKQ